MLSESEVMADIDSYFLEEEEDAGQEIAQGLIIDDLLLNGLSQIKPFEVLDGLLVGGAVEGQLEMGHALELGVSFVLRIHEVLDLRHLELPHSHQPVSRRDLVPKSQADLCSCEGEPSSVELEQLVEVNKHSLGSFGTEIPY